MPTVDTGPLRQLSVGDLARKCRLSERELDRILESRAREYREIVLTNGKTRTLHEPSRRLKLAQKRTLRWLVRRIPPHPCSACVKERGIHWAYPRHAGHPSMLRLDISNFFPSVREGAVKDCLLRLGAREEMANAMVRLVTLPERLPQGAPTSVAVADIVLFRLDVRLAGMAERRGFTYTRYVDDITVSGGKRLARFEDRTKRIVTELGWELNEEKGSLVGPRQRHSLLGAVVNAKPNVSREYFDDVRSCLRRVVDGQERPDERKLRKLESRVDWIISVNPDREQALRPLLADALSRALGSAHRRSDPPLS